MPKELYLIDANSYAYRAFYALRNFSTSAGRPVGAVYGFFNMLFKLINEKRPEYLSLVFDHPAPTFRHKKFEEYKIHRPKMPDDLSGQFPLIKEIISAMNISSIEKPGFEADDILATLARKFESKFSVFIITGDKDIFQTVNSKTKIINTHKDNLTYDEEKVKEKFGVFPGQIVDFIALAGDSADNIPGVPGIGPKTALALIKEFGNLENLYKNLAGIKGKRTGELLLHHRAKAELSQELALLDTCVPIEIEPEDLRWNKFDREKVKGIFAGLEITRLSKRLEELPIL